MLQLDALQWRLCRHHPALDTNHHHSLPLCFPALKVVKTEFATARTSLSSFLVLFPTSFFCFNRNKQPVGRCSSCFTRWDPFPAPERPGRLSECLSHCLLALYGPRPDLDCCSQYCALPRSSLCLRNLGTLFLHGVLKRYLRTLPLCPELR